MLDIVIVGAGLGGLSAACRLAKDGHKVQVLERSDSLSTASGAIFVRSNAVRSFFRWGMKDALEGIATIIERYQTRLGHDNSVLQLYTWKDFTDVPELATDRAALQQLLFNQANQAGATIKFGTTVANISEDEKKAKAELKDGSVITCDLILVADGISSRLRSKILTHLSPEAIAPISVACTHYPTEIHRDLLLKNESTKEIVTGPESKDSLMWACQEGYAIGKYNHARQLFNLMFSIRSQTKEDEDNPRLFDEEGDMNVVRDFFAGYHPVLRALSQMPTECSRWRLARLDPFDTWSTPDRRLALLGDSAHAMMPNLAQGFSCIVEDVDALSLMLNARGDVEDAITLWQDFRMPRTRKLQNGSLFNLKLYQSGRAPGSELTDAERALPAGDGDSEAPFNTLPFDKWMINYNVEAEANKFLDSQAKANGTNGVAS